MNANKEIVENVKIGNGCWVRVDDYDWEAASVADYDPATGNMIFDGVPFTFNNYTGKSFLWGKEIKSFDIAYMVEMTGPYQWNKPEKEWRNPQTNYNYA
jgi:hypothetical protein